MTIRQGRPRARVAVFACVAAVALVFDQLTKLWAQSALADGRTVPIIPQLLSLTLVHNPGASLGFGSSMTWVISLLAVVACVVIVVLAARTVSMRWNAMLALAFAGALGNLIDRVAYADGFLNGKVVDFLNYGWSVGNVADIWLMVAGIGIVALIVTGEPFSKADLVRSDETAVQSDPQSGAEEDGGKDASKGGDTL
ncbi:signal peptidase II [Bifidobacterium biavatii]|uniref:Lipoprotein signal peptidase n=1 Tax=Bifidobacterium biavatii DSM 23969 TaxID=1437608 RepID=A0A087A595_9BIFI|nr:signal peptidase II [Bifidobacterium biavatii]KFI53945.1 lipoprotein signal peptidase [Bifidobacterium biavatii DSM 23969]